MAKCETGPLRKSAGALEVVAGQLAFAEARICAAQIVVHLKVVAGELLRALQQIQCERRLVSLECNAPKADLRVALHRAKIDK